METNRNNFEVYAHSSDVLTHPLVSKISICAVVKQHTDTTCIVHYGVAQCSKKDSFSRKLGRIISKGRAIKKPYEVETINISKDMFNVVKQKVYNLMNKTTNELNF